MSVLSDLETLILRNTTLPPLTNKGADLTWLELDGNFTKLFLALGEILNGANVPAYDNGKTYNANGTVDEKFVLYGSKIWVAVYSGSPSTFTGQTPAESIYWTQTTLAQMLGNPVALTKIAESYNETLSPSLFYETEWQSSNSKTLFSVPIDITELPAQGVGKFYAPYALIFALDFGTTAYNFNNKGIIVEFSGGSGDKLLTIAQSRINSATDVYTIVTVAQHKPCLLNDKMVLTAEVDATVGDGTYYIKVIYQLIDSPF